MKAASKLSYYNLLSITLIAHVNMTLYKYIENVLEYKLSVIAFVQNVIIMFLVN